MALYENCVLQAPDGQTIALQSKKSAKWYLKKGLAETISEDPLVIRLFKEPKGRGRAGDLFYMTPRKNICVVCGTTERLTRHHVVPQFFRKHFPVHLKASANHDVLAACEPCHRAYCVFEEEFKRDLANEAGLDSRGRPKGFPKRILKAASIVKILLTKTDLNDSGRLNLAYRLKDLIGECTDEIIEGLADAIYNEKETNLGKELVSRLNESELIEFSKRWRHHFIDSMNPQYLPEYWDPNREEP